MNRKITCTRRTSQAAGQVRRFLLAGIAAVSLAIGLSCEPSRPTTVAQSAGSTTSTAEVAKPAAAKDVSTSLADDPMIKALLEMKKRDGRDNAMIHYVVAGKLMLNNMPNRQQEQLIPQVLDQGWNASAAPLLPLIEALQPMFQEIRKGTALDYARDVGGEWQGPWGVLKRSNTPVPNFLAAQTSAKMLCVEGRYFESQGKYNNALDDYLTALTLGRDYGTSGATVLGGLISIQIQSTVLAQIHDLVVVGNLDRSTLGRLLARLQAIENTEGPIVETTQREANMVKSWGGRPTLFLEKRVRFLVMKAYLLETQIAAALAAYRLEKGRYPQRLADLAPAYFKAAPLDPFSGVEFKYRCAPDGSSYSLYSVGPDKTDDGGAMRYDSKNGTVSPGDIFF